ncbi:MAG: DUF192 domain-containing protein [Bacteroidales bacterium]|nr:DUF192 domain-containing protein [Candidatus Scybalousia scybalohippi]
METKKISINDKEYKVLIADNEEDRIKGLGNVEQMDDDEGMLFIMPENQKEVVFNTAEMEFDIDIIFINQDDEVYDTVLGKAHSKDTIIATPEENDITKYVLEVNANSGIKIGDELDFEDEEVSEEEIDKMYILGSDGKPQMDLVGGERIISRIETRELIRKAKKANKTKKDIDYKKLGKYIFKVLKKQDSNNPEYVEGPK